ncbi:MAG: T9SS type A sorting domain-containing protein [Saprospiraceae bacterium]|nr:T9SS type A sorting domain-containing protein [Saprospiraceae bacterium]
MKNLFNFKSLFCSLILTLGACLMSNDAYATHSMGADLTYTCIGSNQYLVTLTFYRDCNGIQEAPTQPINFNSQDGCSGFSLSLPKFDEEEITPVCPGIVGSACNGTGIYGIERHVYQDTVTFPTGCTAWTGSWTRCCRNGAITSLTSPLNEQMHIDTEIADASLCNNSPVFLNNPTVFACVGQPVFYNHGAFDADGDQLVYSLGNCYDESADPVLYAPGFSATSPMATTSGVTIDPNTGAIAFTPNVQQVGVICVIVEEYRNGVKIGEIVRDMQFTILNCTNNAPTLSGIDGTSDYSTTVQAGTQLCFDVFSDDPDAGQTTNLSWNGAIPAGSFTSSGSPLANGTFCWTPTNADVGTHSFTITVQDDACPLVGSNTYTYTIEVLGTTPPDCDNLQLDVLSSSDILCSANDGEAIVVASGGTAPYTYQLVNWSTGQVFSNTTGIFDNLTVGTYAVWVEDANGCTPSCTNHTVTIGGNANPLSLSVDPMDAPCPAGSTSPHVADPTYGSLSAVGTGGTAPYLYFVNGGTASTNGEFSQLTPGTYNVTVMDANGCSANETVTIGAPQAFSLTVANMTLPNCSAADGVVTLSASGGTPGYLYYIDGVAQSSPTFTGLAAGTYTFSICDMNYCVYDTTITIPEGTALSAVGTATDVSCFGDCDGSAAVTVSTGSAPYAYAWSNGETSAAISGLCAGHYEVVVTDANGCETVVSVTVAEPAEVTLALASSSNETCAGHDASATLAATGGSAPYSYNIANLTTGTTNANASGAFTGLDAGNYIAQVTDVNGCTQTCTNSFQLGDDCGNGGGNTVISAGSLGTSIVRPFMTLSPNPAGVIVQVRYGNLASEGASLMVLDPNGKMVYQKAGLAAEGSNEITVNSWAAATYFVLLKDKEGKIILTKRLVIE